MNRILNIGLIGYGKMGKMVEEIAAQRGHTISFTASSADSAWGEADVLIEFSHPDGARGNITRALAAGLPLVTGTTGWYDDLAEVEVEVETHSGSLLYASNFSPGVNMFFAINSYLAELMAGYPDYIPHITEVHHTEKVDSPSGTAITLAEDILYEDSPFEDWEENVKSKAPVLGIHAERKPDVPGTHTVTWENTIDRIEMTHTAKSRTGFALGAVLAAEWLAGRRGLYTMTDVLSPDDQS